MSDFSISSSDEITEEKKSEENPKGRHRSSSDVKRKGLKCSCFGKKSKDGFGIKAQVDAVMQDTRTEDESG